MNPENYQSGIFGLLFQTSNALQVFIDQALKTSDLTTKQLMLMMAMSTFKDIDPTLTELAETLGTSYQNVKQLALKLERNGYVVISDDENDKRKKRISLSPKAETYWQERQDADTINMMKLFKGIEGDDLKKLYEALSLLKANINAL